MGNPEMSYIHHLDREKIPPPESRDVGDQGKKAEDVVIEFLKARFPNMEVRHATPEEDEGNRGDIGTKKIIDAVAYLENKPALGLQITTATDSVARRKKLQELQDMPFLRLKEMKPRDKAIPRSITFVEAEQVLSYVQDHNFEQHPKLSMQILESNINSLKFDLLKTKNPEEINRLQDLVAMFEAAKQEIEQQKKGKSNQ
jgi:hypothetical protein